MSLLVHVADVHLCLEPKQAVVLLALDFDVVLVALEA